ncbi:NAD(P)H-dependent oxidoreductase [Limosilactobacillus reuteri]|uniref:flavodoxin family protein n=1 Tax=Limosilactobacillus reuteri TaxID=1598 RepID=UPI001E569BA7|nr:NAD(P)H-dependent oxidoreductase [Limosilactobacillus reuteri]MCC4322871.1 NAD(P)H-dependent oxidoreductase [Limosilactobacillus reuteri]MCC4333174.1 NAD(P)H-dependent oxidoreductase [Limosilactobacillus reuteri]
MKRSNQLNNDNILFINASQNRNGNTAQTGRQLLNGTQYQQLDLVDYKIYQIGQNYPDDQFAEVVDQIQRVQYLVLGTPVYWHAISGYLKVLLERLSQMDNPDILRGKKISVFVQGADPSDTEKPTKNIVQRFANVLGMDYREL